MKRTLRRGRCRTLAPIGADEPAVALRLDRLGTFNGLPDRRLDVVVELFKRNELGAHLDVTARRVEVRAQDAFRAKLRDLEGVVLPPSGLISVHLEGQKGHIRKAVWGSGLPSG